ncbi:COMPASS subunit protein [Saccharomycopsis crataegensis]|uniref:COMPASS subunit protein n=1 Tax=Saccharomycopsis crataegensis TaxID=43959 RepID=A0AAV5QV24_9ASCO|nr:COMPASS subunit protein [Saccharomycopsis crataegensis]
MNLLLLDPFEVAKEYPETLTNSLQYGHSRFLKFNKKGDYLASGLLDGSICIFDADTNQVIAVLKQHTGVVQSLEWSNCGRYLLSSSTDCKVLLWDLKTKTVIREIIFESAVWTAQLHPTNTFVFVCTIFNDDPVYVDWSNENDIRILKIPTTPYQPEQSLTSDKNEDGDKHIEEPEPKKQKKSKDLAFCVKFAYNGKLMFMGTNKGWLNIISNFDNSSWLKTIYSQKICSSHAKQIVISEKTSKIFVNCSDRIIRQLSIHEDFITKYLKNPSEPTKDEGKSEDSEASGASATENNENDEFEIELKYQDVVNRLQWNSITINHNGEYLIASTYGSGAHDIYMWETTMGSLTKVLEGPKEELFDIDWNNKRCCIGANGLDSGYVYLWTNIIPQKWSALAPDFVEIEENVEYSEQEDEFDILPNEEINQRQLNEEDEHVDIITKDEVDARGLQEEESFVIPMILKKDIDLSDGEDVD